MFNKLTPVITFVLSGTASAAIPFLTDDTGTQGTGGNQVETALIHDKAETNDRARELALVYTRGVTEAIDIFIEKGRQTNRPADGPSTSANGNTILGTKWRAWESERKTSFAVKARVALPLSEAKENDGFGSGKTSYDASFILSQEMPWGSTQANLGAGRERNRAAINNTDTTHFSVAPIANLSASLKLGLDLGIDRRKSDLVTEKTRYAELGVIYAPADAVEIGLGYIHTTDHDSKAVTKTISGGLTWRFK